MFKGIINRLFGRENSEARKSDLASSTAAQVVNSTPALIGQDEVQRIVSEAMTDTNDIAFVEPERRVRSRKKSERKPAYKGAAPIPVHAVGDTDEWLINAKKVMEAVIAEGAASYNQIMRALHERNVMGRSGGKWSPTGIKKFIEVNGIAFETKGVRFTNQTKGISSSHTIETDVPAAPPRRPAPAYKSVTQDVVASKPRAPVKDAVDVSAAVLEKPTDVKGHDPLDMLAEPVRGRAYAAREHRRKGNTNLLTTAELDAEVKRRIAAGEYTVLPAGVDSDGNNHFEGTNGQTGSGLRTNTAFNPTGSTRHIARVTR